MDTGMALVGVLVALFYFGGILSIVLLPSWLGRRRGEAVRRQVVLTDALDGQLGPIVAPTVKKPIWGPWRIEVVVPVGRWDTVGRLLALADDVFAKSDGVRPSPYRLVLAAEHDFMRQTRGTRGKQAPGRLAGRLLPRESVFPDRP